MASKTKKKKSGISKAAAKPKKAAAKKVATSKAKKAPAKKVAVKKTAAPAKAPKAPEKTRGLVISAEDKKAAQKASKVAAKAFTKAAPTVALSKILPKEELVASYDLEDNEGKDFEEDEKARVTLEDFVEEEAEGPPEWWKSDPAAIEAEEDDLEGEKTLFDDSDEWTEDDEWSDDEKKSDADSDVDDDRGW
jgi:RNA polymerase primary sigma factor